jgi:hypothetical protein
MAPGETDDTVSQARRLLALQRLYANCVPEALGRASAVANLRDGILFLRAENGAVASKLRHLAPSLLEKIQKTNQEVTQIHVAVQVGREPPAASNARKQGVSLEGVHQIEALTESLPESSLKAALSRLAERQRSYFK